MMINWRKWTCCVTRSRNLGMLKRESLQKFKNSDKKKVALLILSLRYCS